MTTWLVEPRDTLLVRDGRPVLEGSVPMRSLDFPWPSTMAGLVRTRIGLDPATGRFRMNPQEALTIPVQGPLLAAMAPEADQEDLLVPAPRDCLWHRDEADPEVLLRWRLVPRPCSDCETDLGLRGLQLVGPEGPTPHGKAVPGPSFWRWEDLEPWLVQPPAPDAVARLGRGFGRGPLVRERRTHVSIEPGRQTAAEGQIFSTEALRFADRAERLALLLSCEDDRLREGWVQCGGERRLSFLRRARRALPAMPAALRPGRRMRLVLLTPGLFRAGALPSEERLGARIVACVVPRPQVVSGWDLVTRGPKAARRMAPAGSVYWIELEAGQDARAYAEGRWMQCISDEPQDCRDGFGLCAVGVA